MNRISTFLSHWRRISLACMLLLAAGAAIAQNTEAERIAADYARRIQAASTPEEKLRLAQELQEVLKVKQAYQQADDLQKSQPKNATQLGQSELCKSYKATISFTTTNTRTQNCATCGSPCPLTENTAINSQGKFEVVANMCSMMETYTMAGVEDFIFSWSGSGSSTYNSRSKACGSESHSSGTFSYGTQKKPEFHFDLNSLTNWSVSFSIDGTGEQNNDGTTTTEWNSIGFTANNEQGKCMRDGEKFTIEGTFPIDLSAPDQKIVDKATVTYKVVMEPYKESQLVAVLEPLNEAVYKVWRPQGRVPKWVAWKPENDSVIGFRIRILDKGDGNKDVTSKHPFQAEYRLSERTKYTGICNNFPFASDADHEYDMAWDEDSVHWARTSFSVANKDALTTLPTNGGGVKVYLRSKDFGAYAKLMADVTLAENGTVLHAICPAFSNRDHLTIPYDDNNNQMADDWERQEDILWMSWKPTMDYDKFPENGNMGDDIITVDEYRGFIVEKDMVKSFVRFSPNQKELVVAAEGHRPSDAGLGALNFGKISGVKIYTIKCFTDMNLRSVEGGQTSKFNRWINYNGATAHRSYCVVVWINDLMEHNSEASTLNLSGVADGNGSFWPRDVNYITIRLPRVINTAIKEREGWFDWTQKTMSAEEAEHAKHTNARYGLTIDMKTLRQTIIDNEEELVHRFILFTVTHELGHATHMPHHNYKMDTDKDPYAYYMNDLHCPMRYWYTDGLYHETNYDWMLAFLSLQWDPTSLKLPDNQKYEFCKSQDDCWHQMALCPPPK